MTNNTAYIHHKLQRIGRAYSINTDSLYELIDLIRYKYPEAYPELEYLANTSQTITVEIILPENYKLKNIDLFHPEHDFEIIQTQNIDYWHSIRYTIHEFPPQQPYTTKPIGYSGKYDYLPTGDWKIQ